MNFGGHVEAGWLLAHVSGFSRSERRAITLLAVLPDLDGILFFSSYWNEHVHRTFGHNIWVLVFSPLLVIFFLEPKKRLRLLPILYISIGLHFLLDLFVTGWWEIRLLFPFKGGSIIMSQTLGSVVTVDWEWIMKYPIQIGSLAVLTGITMVILVRKCRSPLEVISPRLDAIVVNFLALPWRGRCAYCGKRAFYRCSNCGSALCPGHRKITVGLKTLCKLGCKGKV